jgi:ferredoxin
MKVTVDDERCRGHGVCCALCPGVFELNEGGYAQVVLDDVPGELDEEVRAAAASCPEQAIAVD